MVEGRNIVAYEYQEEGELLQETIQKLKLKQVVYRGGEKAHDETVDVNMFRFPLISWFSLGLLMFFVVLRQMSLVSGGVC